MSTFLQYLSSQQNISASKYFVEDDPIWLIFSFSIKYYNMMM